MRNFDYDSLAASKKNRLFSLKEALCSEERESVEVLLNSDECLKLFGCFREDLPKMNGIQKRELKSRALLMPHQIPALRKRI